MRVTKLLMVVLVSIPFSLSNADSATQTDWSGGPGIYGPVLELGNEFYLDTDVNWYSNPGDIVLQFIAEHAVAGDFNGAKSIYLEDIDGDSDMDVLGAASWADDITWWENIDGSGTSWVEHTIDGDFWFARSVYSEDVDGDGDMDVLGAAYNDDDITWWENEDGSGTSWTEHTVDGDFDGAYSVYSEDIDSDGDMDILGAGVGADDITWWENIDGLGTSWAEHIVDGDYNGANSVYSEDIDGDGDMDILGAAVGADDITWWENIDGLGTSWAEHIVDGDFNAARSVYSEDIDGDGDMDVLGAAEYQDDITWWENIDGSGTSWTEHTVDGEFWGASSIYSEDIDGDGGMDVLGAAYLNDDIAWWDLAGYISGGSLESTVLDTQEDPDWDYLEWSSQTPSGTSVSFQVRASDDYTAMGAWSDTLISPCPLASILNDGDRYVQYRTILETSNPDSTPTLNDITISWNPLGIDETAEPIPSGISLLLVKPNPVKGTPVIRFGLQESAPVEIFVFDLSGRLVSEIHNDEYSPGYHNVLPGDFSPGIYFCRMISGDFTATQRFVVIE